MLHEKKRAVYDARMRHGTRAALALIAASALAACAPQGEARQLPGGSPSARASASSSVGLKRFVPKPPAKPGVPAPVAPPTGVSVPILVYHHVRPQQGWAKSTWSWKMTVTPATFERHMQWLADKGYTSLTLDGLVAALDGKASLPAKPVVITFDDNNQSQYDLAAPLMEKYGMIGVFYAVSGRIDSKELLNREKILDLSARGHDIQSHTVSHQVLPLLGDAALKTQLEESKKTLEDLLGKPVNHLAYPGTAHNQRVRDAAKAAGYVTATIMDPRNITEKDDRMKWARIMMTDDTVLEKVIP